MNHAVAAGLLALAVLATGCLRDTRPTTERGGSGIGGNAPEVLAPEKDRCELMGKSEARKSCDDAKAVAKVFARRLSIGDRVCLENGVGDEPDVECAVRTAVVDTAQDRNLLEIRAARPDSKWFQKVGSQIWFEEGALVDLYLAERGY